MNILAYRLGREVNLILSGMATVGNIYYSPPQQIALLFSRLKEVISW
jgi:hypothetical protein